MLNKPTKQPQIIEGGFSIDQRGQVTFFNEFNFDPIKRFYIVENFSLDTVRGFHGHLKEEKFAFVVSGSALFNLVEIDNTAEPNKNNEVKKVIISSRKPVILYIPAGFAHGFKALEKETKIIFFSTATLDESKADDYRYDWDYWGKEMWGIKNF